MHRSLSIPEILSMIFSGIDRHTLSGLARTCKLFHDPALNLLWRYQGTLVPLLKSMPPDLWEETTTGGLHFRRPLISTDLEASNKYAWRIISLVFIYNEVDVEVLEALGNMSTTPLLPNLRKFTGILPENIPPSYRWMNLFLGARTEAINIFLNHSETALSFIPSIKTRCPTARDLTLHSDINEHVVQAISDLICEYVELESLDVNGLASHALAHIATYSALRCLKLGDLRVKDICSIKGPGIARVSILEVTTGEDAMTFDSFLSLVRPQQLQELSLILLYEISPPTLWQQCFQTLTQCCSATLTDLYIEEGPMPSDEAPRYAMDYPTLKCLLPFQHLVGLTLLCGGYYELDDDGLRHMSMAWPRLEVLSLHTCFESSTQVEVSQITLRGLVPLLEYCPELMELDIAIASGVFDLHPLRIPEQDIFNDKIVSMAVGNSVINDAASVAAFFSRFLPSIQCVTSWERLEYMDSDLDDELDDALREARQYHSRWVEVSDLMNATRVVRQQENAPYE